jgi:predicted DNA-binding protein (MmcQ/YjbR family)
MKPEAILKKLRPICLALGNTEERQSWGHPTFTVGGKSFAVFEQYKTEWCLCFRVELAHRDLFLKDARFFVTPYIGKHGWLSLRVHAARLNWEEIRHLMAESHRLVSGAKSCHTALMSKDKQRREKKKPKKAKPPRK